MKSNNAEAEKLSDGVRAVDRALDILMAFTATDYELTAAQLLKRVDLSRPTLYRLLYTLEQSDFLISEGDPQRFRLGPSVAHLAHVWTASLDMSTVAQPYLRRIWQETGETVALFVPEGNSRICVAEIASIQPLSFKRGVGYKERLGLGASGRAILAFSDYDANQLQQLTQGLDISLDRYEHELEAIRLRGYALSREELIAGAIAVAAPFFDGGAKPAGSIVVFGPSVRMDEERIGQIGQSLRREGEELSRALGLRQPTHIKK